MTLNKPSGVGAKALAIRKSRSLTQATVEEMTGISQSYISQLERGDISDPGGSVLRALADAYGVTMMDFYDEADDDQINESLESFLNSPLASDVTADEENQLRRLRLPKVKPTAKTWYLLLEALRSGTKD